MTCREVDLCWLHCQCLENSQFHSLKEHNKIYIFANNSWGRLSFLGALKGGDYSRDEIT